MDWGPLSAALAAALNQPSTDAHMLALDEALDREIEELDSVLLRLTTLRLLMAAGKHEMVDRAIQELEASMACFEAAESVALSTLSAGGYADISAATSVLAPEDRARLERRAATLRRLHRDVRVAMASTGAAAERAIRSAAQQFQGSDLIPQRRNNPFLTND